MEPAGLTFTAGTGTGDATMTFTGTLASINAALNGLSFAPTADYNGSASLQISTSDQGNTGSGGALTDTKTLAITVSAVNDAPIVSVPGSQTVDEDTTLTFSTAGGNAISVGDVDASGGPVQFTLTATNGTLQLSTTAGLSFTAGSGLGDATMTFTGTLANVNAALDGLQFVGATNYNGPSSLQVSVSDQGNTGAGGAQTASGTVNITVVAVNDAPTIVGPTLGSSYSTGVAFSAATGNALLVDDVDAGSAVVQLTLTANGGTITLGDTSGVSIVTGNAAHSAFIVATGTVADLNAALDGLTFLPSVEHATLQVQVNDLGNSGQGSAAIASKTVQITQAPLIIIQPTSGIWIPPQGAAPATPRVEPTPVDARVAATPTVPIAEVAHRTTHHATVTHVSGSVANRNWLVAANADEETTEQLPEWATMFRADVMAARTSAAAVFAKNAALLNPSLLWSQMDALAEQIVGLNLLSQLTAGAACLSGTLSVGYVIWCLRSGSLVASAVSSLPLWRSFDPLPVLDFWEREDHAAKNRREADEATPDEDLLQNLMT